MCLSAERRVHVGMVSQKHHVGLRSGFEVRTARPAAES
jgi:hypothetical protein